jgi:hypothetical protein
VAGATRHEGGSNGAARVPSRDSGHAAGGLLVESLQPRRTRRRTAGGPDVSSVAHGARRAPHRERRQNGRRSAPACRRRCVAVAVEMQLVVLRPQGPAFCLAQTSPDAVRLTDAQRVAEARLPHGTCGANCFGLLFSLELLALPLEVRRWEEDDGLRTTTCGTNLPVILNTLCAHRHTPLQSRTIQPLPGRNQRKVVGVEYSRDTDAYQVSGVVKVR